MKKRNEPPAYVFDLVEIIRAKGKDITKSAQTIERETVKTYKGVDLYETPDGFRIRAEGKSAQEGGWRGRRDGEDFVFAGRETGDLPGAATHLHGLVRDRLPDEELYAVP